MAAELCYHALLILEMSLERIHVKNPALFSLKDESKKIKCRLLQFLFGT